MNHPPLVISSRQKARLGLALSLLAQGAEEARSWQTSIWDFAVEIDRLQAFGVTNNDLRRLIFDGLIEHRVEVRSLQEKQRSFRTIPNLCFTKRSCFVLRAVSCAAATPILEKQATPMNGEATSANDFSSVLGLLPCWDPDLRQLRVGDHVVKEFRQRSLRQVTVLAAFQSQAWPQRIDDPLSAVNSENVQGLLHYTIQNLNRNQLRKLLHFFGDGTRRGVCWRFVTI
jgi:hypothetical protein